MSWHDNRGNPLQVSACAKAGEWEYARLLLLELREASTANRVTYNAVLSACEKGEQLQMILAILEEMVQLTTLPDSFSYSASISGCGRCEQWQVAVDLLRVAHSMKSLNVIAYSAAVSACEKAKEWQQALALFEEARVQSIEADVVLLSAAISACEKGEKWWLALELFDSSQANLITYSAAISACEKGGQWQKVLQLLLQMPGADACPAVVNQIWHMLLKVLC